MKIQVFGLRCKICHIFVVTGRMAGYEIRYQLLIESGLAINAVKQFLEFSEILKTLFSHQLQHPFGSVLRCHFQSARNVFCDKFAQIFLLTSGCVSVFHLCSEHIVAYAAANVGMADAGNFVNRAVDIGQCGVIDIEVGTYGRMNA